ncbi:MAG: hypothetical protein KC616_22335 [Myxococcales bacterium]|nr:hypothetical protein [Myxococcales bacterium]
MTEPRAERTGGRRRVLRRDLILTGSIVTACFAVIIALSVFVPIAAQLSATSVDSEMAFGLAEHFLFLHAALWPVIVLSLVASVVSGHLLYQRMRSPLIRFVRCYDEVAAGQTPAPIRIRQGDYLTGEAEALNDMLAALRRERAAVEAARERLEAFWPELARQEVAPDALEELQEIAKALSASGARGSDVDSPL